jgi:hypothetical protein
VQIPAALSTFLTTHAVSAVRPLQALDFLKIIRTARILLD